MPYASRPWRSSSRRATSSASMPTSRRPPSPPNITASPQARPPSPPPSSMRPQDLVEMPLKDRLWSSATWATARAPQIPGRPRLRPPFFSSCGTSSLSSPSRSSVDLQEQVFCYREVQWSIVYCTVF